VTDKVHERLDKMTPLQRAVFALKETQARLDALERLRSQPIAIVGMACRFPGGAVDPASYWQLLCTEVDAIRETPADRWNPDTCFGRETPGQADLRWGGFLDRIDEFDNHFFGISDREAELMDPQQRMLLELAWEALEDAGMPPSSLRGSRTGVFVGIGNSDYGILLSRDTSQSDAYVSTGSSLSIAANRISFAFDLTGPSVAMDTACSSSLVALHQACLSIRHGESEMALVAGANLMLSPVPTANLAQAGFLASDGHVRAFDKAATGYVRGEGAGVIVVKPLAAAVENRDPIYAVIRGSAVNQNGSSNGLTAPSRQAQEKALRQAYSQAKVSPGQVQYVEAQGTGTELGDAIEAMALGSVLREDRPPGADCALGSVKTNIGHLETASGMASVIKVALALQHNQIPATLHFNTPNPNIPFDDLPLTVQKKLGTWPDESRSRLAGVSAFGFGGSNAHVVLEEAPSAEGQITDDAPAGDCPQLLPLSARTEKALEDLARRYRAFFRGSPPKWPDVCYTAACRRDHHDCRLVLLASSHSESIDQLDAFLASKQRSGVVQGRKPFGRDPKIAFVFSGDPEQWKTCRLRLAKLAGKLPEAFSEVDGELQRVLGWPLSKVLDGDDYWDKNAYVLPAVVALQLVLTSWWRSVGVAPDVVFGHGVGELSAACAAGILTMEEALRVARACGSGDTSHPLDAFPARSASIPFISATDGRAHTARELSIDRWRKRVEDTADLSAAIEALHERRADVCLEIGPPLLVEQVTASADSQYRSVALASFGATCECLAGLLAATGALYASGATLLWERVVAPGSRCVGLPSYPWQRQRLWALDKNPFVEATSGAVAAADHDKQLPRGTVDDSGGTEEIRARPDLNSPYVAPRTPLEEQLSRSWSTVLRIERVGMYDNFFELGGDSLQATVLLNGLQESLGETVQAHALFEVQTIDDLGAYLRRHYADAVRRLHPHEPGLPAPPDVPDDSLSATHAAIPRLSRERDGEQGIVDLDGLTDDEVQSLLEETLAESDHE
jgi:acyl transferase domain-containing protein